jgi:DNA-binding transcriptional LysR family regulator
LIQIAKKRDSSPVAAISYPGTKVQSNILGRRTGFHCLCTGSELSQGGSLVAVEFLDGTSPDRPLRICHGIPVFDRVPDGLTLTIEGRAVLESARKMEMASFDVVRRQARQDVVERGDVSISITEGLGAYWVTPRLVDFKRHYPFIIINLQCAMHDADLLRLESDMAVQFSMPNKEDLMVVKLGRLHVHPFASQSYLNLYGVPKVPADLVRHCIIQQLAPGIRGNDLAAFFELEKIDDIVAMRTNSSTVHFYAVEKGVGIGVLPTFAVALGAPVVPIDIGGRYHLDVLLTYHADARKTPRRALAIDWLKSIFDPKTYPWFRDEFIHPNELIQHMPPEARMNFGKGYFSVTPT